MTEDVCKSRGARFGDGGASGILGPGRQHQGDRSWTERALQRLRHRSLIVHSKRNRGEAEGIEEIDESRECRILDGNLIAGSGVFAQHSFDRV